MSIAANLRRAVDENGVSAASLAREIGAEPSTVRRYLSGAARPNDAVLARLSACLVGWSPEELRFGKETSRRGKLTTDEVSRITGIDPLSLRVGLQRGIWSFGTAYKRPGSTQYTYEYDPEAVIRYVTARDAMRGGGKDHERRIPPAAD
ncbi:MAG: helix-turn-helix transcriptional regulator [Clostridia bacterium]|nr:helix-turn-helix transcriptional regulator [Clostridia bacterium]